METLEQTCNRLIAGMTAITPDKERENLESMEYFKRQDILGLRSEWNAPKRHALFTIKEPKGKWGEKLAVLEGMATKGYIAALVGSFGTGKTQLAVELMKHATRNLRSAYFTTAMEFFEEVKSSYRQDSKHSELGVLRRFRRPALLVVDEIGKRSDNDWENNLLFAILNARYNDLTDTVVIDNRTKLEFIATIGSSLASRISETGGIIDCAWESFR